MEELCKKYPALFSICVCVSAFSEVATQLGKDNFYAKFKLDLNKVGLEPLEYETVIKWFCDTMEY